MQEELNELIEGGVQKITTLVRNTEMAQTIDIESGILCTHTFFSDAVFSLISMVQDTDILRIHLLFFESVD